MNKMAIVPTISTYLIKIDVSLNIRVSIYRRIQITFGYLTTANTNGWLGGSVVRALARDRKVASSTPGQSATK